MKIRRAHLRGRYYDSSGFIAGQNRSHTHGYRKRRDGRPAYATEVSCPYPQAKSRQGDKFLMSPLTAGALNIKEFRQIEYPLLHYNESRSQRAA